MSSFVPRAAKRLRLSTRAVTPLPVRAFSSSPYLAEQKPGRNDEKTTHFGFESIAESLKESKVGAVFSSVASSYDTMNDLMSLGIHRLWKDHFVRSLNPGSHTPGAPQTGWKILDIAGGTGDIAFRILDHATNINHDPNTHVTISDINPDMLAEGRKRAAASHYNGTGRLDFVEANAEDLHMIPDNSMDLYTVSFGIRNFTHKDIALKEAFRVLKPGGVFACLEFSKVNNPVFDFVYKRWSFAAIPLIGQVVAGDRDSYQYLVESIERFPSQTEWRDMIKEAGFVVPGGENGQGWEDLTNGIAAIHKGIKPLN
ncbi:unnamed protein product [Aureobasidium mustum]|uniref:2-methoxy-6-polyprenyl-1,4-benzoquinol methylase, mitochondrial n=1 Tax=Aureobasidium mustum TaxID=2773714 RepID=A0A9N8K4W6_9PEZI|nr:unnamed protein product [Aureobasidium mustum]